jgi:flagella basal body P-ring formation protein FlgA
VAAREGATVALDAAAVQQIAHRAGLDWANAEGLRTIVVHAGLGHAAVARAGSSAAAAAPRGNVEVLTYTRSLSAGEIVQPSDVVWAKAAAATIDTPSDAEAVIGQVAKRPLREGAVVQARDLGAAQVIKTGDVVIVSYAAGGVSLALEGKAMGSAGVGEMLAVQNTVSKRVVQTLVTGPGQAVVGPQAEELKTARSIRYAVR